MGEEAHVKQGKTKERKNNEEGNWIGTIIHKLDHGHGANRAPYDYFLGKFESGGDGLRQGVSHCPHSEAGIFREQEFLQTRAFGRSLAR